jgi:hypothetical protein
MTLRLHGPEERTYGATRAIERLTAASDAIRGVIMHEVPDQEARGAALHLVAKALDVAVQGVMIGA